MVIIAIKTAPNCGGCLVVMRRRRLSGIAEGLPERTAEFWVIVGVLCNVAQHLISAPGHRVVDDSGIHVVSILKAVAFAL